MNEIGRSVWRLRALMVLALIWLAPTLACGSFAPRPTPTPTLALVSPTSPTSGEPNVEPVATPFAEAPTATPTAGPTPTVTPTPQPGTALAAGQPARVTAPNGLNMRDQPSTGSALIVQLGTGQRVTVLQGPTDADGYRWWQVDDGQGKVGWVADSDGETEWLSPRIGEPQAVNRPPKVGDRVTVTMAAGGQLSVRAVPGSDAPLIVRADPGQQFTVLAKPQAAGGYNWYQIRSDDGTVEGWAADGDAGDRWLSPLE